MNTRHASRKSSQTGSVIRAQSWFVLRVTIFVLALCSALSIPFAVNAANVIKVYVICKGVRIADVDVELFEGDKLDSKMRTDEGGRANITGVRPGTYKLVVHCPDGVFTQNISVPDGVDESHTYLFRCCPTGRSGLIAIDGTSQPAPPETSPTAPSKTAKNNGLQTVKFEFDLGQLVVNLPDNMAAGDTISGVVTPEPKGGTDDERNKNRDALNGFVVFIGGEFFPVSGGKLGPIVLPGGTILGTPPGSTGNMPPLPPSFFDVFVMPELPGTAASGRARIPLLPSGAVITPDPKITTPPGMTPSGAVITPDPKITPTFIIPPLGQTGRPSVITGPFDGNSENTKLTIGGQPLTLLAESPRQVVFQNPSNVTGPAEVSVIEGDKETKGAFRNLKIDLTAPKTSLLKGESTELHVEVNGLEGIKQPVPLTLESHGVITMVGGNYQRLEIQPSQVGADGRYITTRGITGVQTGGWEATATVVTHKFDICLQDDTTPARRILWNTFNGDYMFICPGCWPPKGQQGGATGTTGAGGTKTGGATETGGTTAGATGGQGSSTDPPGGLTGKGKMIMKGCILTLEHNEPDRRVFSTLDSCTSSGTSTVEDPKTKVKFTITDRNIADNACSNQ